MTPEIRCELGGGEGQGGVEHQPLLAISKLALHAGFTNEESEAGKKRSELSVVTEQIGGRTSQTLGLLIPQPLLFPPRHTSGQQGPGTTFRSLTADETTDQHGKVMCSKAPGK